MLLSRPIDSKSFFPLYGEYERVSARESPHRLEILFITQRWKVHNGMWAKEDEEGRADCGTSYRPGTCVEACVALLGSYSSRERDQEKLLLIDG